MTHFVAVQHDVTAEVAAQQAAVDAAARDSLTGLLNRSALAAGLERELARAGRQGTTVAVLFFDLDAFKDVNDTHGHLVGDAYLRHVAACLRRRLRAHDLAARVGGDEFVAVVTDLPDDGGAAVEHVVADLRGSMAEPFTVDGVEHRVSVSVGVALAPADGTTVRELIAHSDTAMYRHKSRRDGPAPSGPAAADA
ncbi:GGDEF domain-containing protein [Cellulomonas sp. ATA003]|uniref:GGDEF domain-containing protein n=1 Tax=Cellulomonas sp. ATA003 TaxID=3073064 RepID=UPI002872BA9B|nr:GGDEF domain-containing protein [Cellulomonas sp. ATA003]WNB85694.1 GGDEF domain-containing protein [Cellulomonas sp. ATA003]